MRPRSVLDQGFLLIAVLMFVSLAPPPSAAEDALPRYQPDGRLLDGPADWVSVSRDRLAFGSDTRITIATVNPSVRREKVWDLDERATDGQLIGSDLYFVRQSVSGDELVVTRLDGITPSPRSIQLVPVPRGSLQIAQMDDYLLVAEDGYGVRILKLPAHHDGHHGHAETTPTAIGLFATDEPIHALGVSLRKIYLSTPEHLVEIHADIPSSPILARRIPLERPVHALDANNDTVYLLGDDGLRTLDLAQGGTVPHASFDSEIRGNAVLALGRDFYVASGTDGLTRFHDESQRMATFVVAIGDSFFNPGGALPINTTDTVEWQKPGTVFQHNVFSCTAAQAGCGGQTSNETFTSGTPRTGAFTFAKTFFLVGNNPYVCQVHNATMQGDIVVSMGGASPPPGVPDTAGLLPPMRVDKLIAGGANLGIQFDTSCPDAVNHDLIFGTRADLPAVQGGTYTPGGSQCAVGASPFNWNLTPTAPAGDYVWWLLVADDGVAVEGSWGRDGRGAVPGVERGGQGLNGSSNLCANTDKDLTNTCGQ